MRKIAITTLLFVVFTSSSATEEVPLDQIPKAYRKLEEKYRNDPKAQEEIEELRRHYENEHDEELDELLLKNAPEKVQFIIKKCQKLKEHPELMPRKLLLVGPPGTGKTALAIAIAHALKRPYKYINIAMLLDKYKHSGAENVRKEIDPILEGDKEYVIILDELDCLVKQYNNPNDPEPAAAHALLGLLDKNLKNPNVLIIAATNTTDTFPEALKNRLQAYQVRFKLPGTYEREETIRFYLNRYGNNISDEEIQKIVTLTKNYSHRRIKDLIESSAGNALVNFKILEFEDIKKEYSTYEQPTLYDKTLKHIEPGTKGNGWVQTGCGVITAGAAVGGLLYQIFHPTTPPPVQKIFVPAP